MKKIARFLFLGLFVTACSAIGNQDNDLETIMNVSSEDVAQASELINLETLTFFEGESFSDDRQTSIEIISIEEAAQIGAHFVYQILGNNLENMYMKLIYNFNPHIFERSWTGAISTLSEFKEDWSNVSIIFSINAETGERIELINREIEPLHGINDFQMETMPESELLEIFPEPDAFEIASMKEVVREIADKHLENTEIVAIEYGFWTESGEPATTYFPSQISPFFVIDTNDQLIEINIQRETHTLVTINTTPLAWLTP